MRPQLRRSTTSPHRAAGSARSGPGSDPETLQAALAAGQGTRPNPVDPALDPSAAVSSALLLVL